MKKHNKIVVIQGDNIKKINPKTDTTLLLALEAQKRGYTIYYYETQNLNYSENIVYALTNKIEFNTSKKNFYSIKNLENFILLKLTQEFKLNTLLLKK